MAGTKQRNLVGTDTITITLSNGLLAHLDQLARTHLYGKTGAETAAHILINEVRRMVVSGELEKMKGSLPAQATFTDSETVD